MAGREPSMEDILASIKKVIAEEKELRSAVSVAAPLAPAEPEPEPEEPAEEEILELDEPVVEVGSSRVDLQACKLEYSIVSPK